MNLITDAELTHIAVRVDHVVLVIDSICIDLSAVNKLASLSKSFGAKAASVPYLTAADNCRLDPARTAETIMFEEMSAEKI